MHVALAAMGGFNLLFASNLLRIGLVYGWCTQKQHTAASQNSPSDDGVPLSSSPNCVFLLL
jgi:hypothetical protein